MSLQFGIDQRFLDRRGCGDEFYLDSRFKAALLLGELDGAERIPAVLEDENYDDVTGH